MTVVKISELPQKDALEDGDKVIAWNSANGATSVLLGTAFTAIKEASATSASAAKASENAAKNLASEASSSADSASESASGAALSAEAAKASETNALASANSASASQTQIESDIAQAKLDITTERTAAVSAVEAAQATAISSIQTQGTESVTAVTAAQATSVSAVKAQEAASIQAIEADSVLAGYVKEDELFGNDGAGPTLRPDILPAATADTPGAVTTGDGITNTSGKLSVDLSPYAKVTDVAAFVAEAKLAAHPVGSIYCSVDSANPSSLFGGTWEQVSSGRVLQGADSSHSAGTTAEAGLPNITGEVLSVDPTFLWGAGTNASGAFKDAANSTNSHIGSNGWNGSRPTGFTFNASWSSAIYGASSTVQPPAFFVYIWKRTA